MVEAIAASMPAMLANKQLLKGISPGVRASGPFAKQISQANRNQNQANRNQNQASKAAMKNSMRAAGNVAGKALGGMGPKFGK
jgi:hypothetical protein